MTFTIFILICTSHPARDMEEANGRSDEEVADSGVGHYQVYLGAVMFLVMNSIRGEVGNGQRRR